MGLVLFVLFLGVPLAEIALFVVVGGKIGVLATVAVVIVTAVAGAWLVRRQGLETLNRARADIERNVMPADAMGEGLAILAAGALLLTPGFLTDAIGFTLLVPPARRAIVSAVGRWLAGRVTVVDMGGMGGMGAGAERRSGPRRRDDVIDVEAIEIEIDDEEAGENGGSGKRLPRDPRSPWRSP